MNCNLIFFGLIGNEFKFFEQKVDSIIGEAGQAKCCETGRKCSESGRNQLYPSQLHKPWDSKASRTNARRRLSRASF